MPIAPEYQAMLDQLAAGEPAPGLAELPVAEGRAVYQAMRPVNPALPIGRIEDTVIPGPHDIPIRIYYPDASGTFPVMVFYHGGGWVIGDLETADAACRNLAMAGQWVVVSVDYRLAPEHVFPAAVEDAYAAVVWATENTDRLQGNGRIAVGGESAGGNLAAVVSLKARDEDGPAIHCQCLLYPVTDIDTSHASYAENGSGYILEEATMAWFWATYCPDAALRRDPMATPQSAGSLANLPPAVVVTAEFDILRDEGSAYAQAMQAAGGEVTHLNCAGLLHDFLGMVGVFQCVKAPFEETVAAVNAALAKAG